MAQILRVTRQTVFAFRTAIHIVEYETRQGFAGASPEFLDSEQCHPRATRELCSGSLIDVL